MGRFFTRVAITSASVLIAAAGMMVAVVFLIVAFYLFLASLTAPWIAALATAGAAVLFSLLVIAIGRLATRRKKGRLRGASPATELGILLGREALALAEKNSRTMLLASIAAGFAIGFSPKLRAALRKLL